MLASHVHADAPDQRSAVFEPAVTDPAAFRTPLDVLAAEHTRQITICDMLDRWVRGPRRTDPAELKAVHDYLVLDLPLHIEDEDGDLFPLLKRRLPLGDDTEAIFAQLHAEHEADRALQMALVRDLECLIRQAAFEDPAHFFMNAFAFSQALRRHLAWENAVIMTRARRHLTEEDCAELGRRMAARRGLSLPD